MRSAAGLIFRLAAFFCAGMAGMKEENVNFSPGISGKKVANCAMTVYFINVAQ